MQQIWIEFIISTLMLGAVIIQLGYYMFYTTAEAQVILDRIEVGGEVYHPGFSLNLTVLRWVLLILGCVYLVDMGDPFILKTSMIVTLIMLALCAFVKGIVSGCFEDITTKVDKGKAWTKPFFASIYTAYGTLMGITFAIIPAILFILRLKELSS